MDRADWILPRKYYKSMVRRSLIKIMLQPHVLVKCEKLNHAALMTHTVTQTQTLYVESYM